MMISVPKLIGMVQWCTQAAQHCSKPDNGRNANVYSSSQQTNLPSTLTDSIAHYSDVSEISRDEQITFPVLEVRNM